MIRVPWITSIRNSEQNSALPFVWGEIWLKPFCEPNRTPDRDARGIGRHPSLREHLSGKETQTGLQAFGLWLPRYRRSRFR